jgi:putative flippase GtrA
MKIHKWDMNDLITRGLQFLKNLFHFGIFSGIGLTMDVTLFYIMVHILSFNVILSNIISAFTAVTFVFLTSNRIIFKQSDFSYVKYIVYIIYQAVAIISFSFLIKLLINIFSLPPVVSKIIVVPFSFLLNYFCTRFIILFRTECDRRSDES